jgi:hypothetical protein
MQAEAFYTVSTLLGILTLVAILWYAFEARRTANAGNEQSEALQRPCLVILQPADTSDDAVLESMTSSVLGEVTVRFKNIGQGPATNIRFRFRTLSKPAGPLEMDQAPEAGPLAPGEPPVDTNYPVKALDERREEMVIEYSSLSGTRYRSRAVIESRRWVSQFHFSKITGSEG